MPTSTHRTVTVHLCFTLKAFSLSKFVALHVQIAGFAMWEQSVESCRNRARSEMNEPFFLHPLGTERITANHITNGGLNLSTEPGRFGVGIRVTRSRVLCLVVVRLLRGIVSGFWTPIPSRLVVSHEVRVGTGTGQLWVVATCGGIVGRAAVFILVLQK